MLKCVVSLLTTQQKVLSTSYSFALREGFLLIGFVVFFVVVLLVVVFAEALTGVFLVAVDVLVLGISVFFSLGVVVAFLVVVAF